MATEDIGKHDIERVLARWGLKALRIEEIRAGHINRTFRVEAARGVFALQRLSPIFDPAIHHDIESVTAELERAGMTTPRLVPARGRLWIRDDRGGIWRLMTWVEGRMLLQADCPARCTEAGRLLGGFHRILWDSKYQFSAVRLGVHDTARHLEALERAVEGFQDHRAHRQIAPLAEEILRLAGPLGLPAGLPERVVHGDPKISNVLFDSRGRAVCLVDLDTLGRLPIAVELGDAFRSWCNSRGEDEPGGFDVDFFTAGIAGWAGAVGDLPSDIEREAIAPAVEMIAVELAARFCRDALEETYFGWDETRYPSASEHNLARARAQLALAQSVRSLLPAMERIVRSAW